MVFLFLIKIYLWLQKILKGLIENFPFFSKLIFEVIFAKNPDLRPTKKIKEWQIDLQNKDNLPILSESIAEN